MCGNTTLRQEESRVRLKHRHHVGAQPIAGKAFRQRVRVDHFMRQIVDRAGSKSAANHRALSQSRVDAAGDDEKPLTGNGLELAPQRVRPPQQRHVIRMFRISEPDDPAASVRRTELVSNAELLEAKDTRTAAGEMEQRCAAHPAQADDDRVVAHVSDAFAVRSPVRPYVA